MELSKITSLIIVIAILIAVREGFQQRDRIDPGNGYSKAWHWFGFLMRLLVAGVAFRASQSYILTGLIIIILWPVYNVACNIGAKKKWYYVSDKGIDGIIRKIFFFVDFDK